MDPKEHDDPMEPRNHSAKACCSRGQVVLAAQYFLLYTAVAVFRTGTDLLQLQSRKQPVDAEERLRLGLPTRRHSSIDPSGPSLPAVDV